MSRQKLARADEIAVSLARLCILIVDDDETFLEGARDYFATCGCDVDTARTPEEATEILQREGEYKYQLIVTDYDFGMLSKTKGDKFVRENQPLFGKAKIVVISGAVGITREVRRKLKEAETLFLEKNPILNTKLKALTQEENEKRATDLKRVVKTELVPRIEELTGRPVDIKISAPQPDLPLSEVALDRLKGTIINWLKSRRERDDPVFAYGKGIYTANEMIKHVEDETSIGRDHIMMLLEEFEYSQGTNDDDSRQYDDDDGEYTD